MPNRPDWGNWIFAILVGGGIFAFSIAVFVFSYLRLRSS